jgi:hypothetical protein
MKQEFELDKAVLLMVEALYIAATQDKETAVADYLEDQLTGGTLSLSALRQHFDALFDTSTTPLHYHQHPLDEYDHLLNYPQTRQLLSNPKYSPCQANRLEPLVIETPARPSTQSRVPTRWVDVGSLGSATTQISGLWRSHQRVSPASPGLIEL